MRTAREQLEAIRNAPGYVIVLDTSNREVERHHFTNLREAEVFNAELSLPEGWTTIVGANVNDHPDYRP